MSYIRCTSVLRLFLVVTLLSGLVSAKELDISHGALRTSYESVTISPSEDMGLLGISYLFEPNEYFYYGASVYGTLSGKRGGFFVGGFSAGVKYPLYKKLLFDTGAFVGGGGGGSAPQGGGLMLKGYGGLLYEFDGYSLGANYSYVKFPNGDIDSSGVSVVADVKFDTLFVPTPLKPEYFKNARFLNKRDYMVATAQVYFPKEGTKKVNATPLDQNIKLAGFEYGQHISPHTIAYIETAGALGGDSTGYMEILGGLGYSQDILRGVSAQAKLSLGSAGGGQVNTGGGAISKASLNLNYDISKDITFGLSGGYYHAFEGEFDALFSKVQLGFNTNLLTLSKEGEKIAFDSLASQKFIIRFAHQTYIYSEDLSTRDDGVDVHLVGTKIDWFLTQNIYVSGQAFAAYKGGAGGYATGAFGVGYVQALLYDISLVTELNAGAGGGGSIETGVGAILQPMAGLRYDFDKKFGMELLAGKVIAIDGVLDTNVIEWSLIYRFDKLIQK